MEKYASILRGINVSGHNIMKMKALQAMCEGLGFRNVQSYIQSGNLVFESESASTEKLSEIISEGILKSFGFNVPVIVIRKDQLKSIAENNRYIHERGEDESRLHVTFLSAEPEPRLAGELDTNLYLPDEFYISGRSVFLFCPNGYGNTRLSNVFFEKKLKVRATTRNWKTLLELVKMIE